MWKRVRLELARTPQFPAGSKEYGYEVTAPLDEQGHLVPEEWRKAKGAAVVRRFWHGEEQQTGNLIHTRHRTWAFSYAPGEDDDEPVFKLDHHRLVQGEYVSVTERGVTRPFHVASVVPVQ